MIKLLKFQEGVAEVLNKHFAEKNIFVGDGIPSDAPKPYIFLGDVETTSDGTKTSDLSNTTINIIPFTNNNGKAECLGLCDEIVSVLTGGFEIEGEYVIDAEITSIQVRETSDVEIVGQVSLRVSSQNE